MLTLEIALGIVGGGVGLFLLLWAAQEVSWRVERRRRQNWRRY